MSIRKAIAFASMLALTSLALTSASADARATRELLTSFGSFEEPSGLAVDLETGNVYVADNKTETVYVFGPTGGAPVDGVPSRITGLSLAMHREPSGLSIDNSCYEHQPRLTGNACEEYDPSYGDLYVTATFIPGNPAPGLWKFKLNPGHEYELVGAPMPVFNGADEEQPLGVTVDSRGNIYIPLQSNEEHAFIPGSVIEFKKIVEKVFNGGVEEIKEKLEEIVIPQNLEIQSDYIAVDDLGDIYLGTGFEGGGVKEGYRGVAKLKVGPTGSVTSEGVLAGLVKGARRPVAVNRLTGAVYVGDGSEIAEYNSTGALQLMFGSTEPLGGSFGIEANGATAIAVNSETDRVYVANQLRHDVDVFGPAAGPPVIEAQQPAASNITRTSALIAGVTVPESIKAEYYFQYVAGGEYEPTATDPYRAGGRTAIESLSGGHTAQTVERLPLTGLRPGTTYHYRMVVSNATATTDGPDETFTTAAATPPSVSTGPAGEVSQTSVVLSGVVNPRGIPTSYVFEVGADTSYGGAKLFGSAGAGTGEVPVTVALQYLVPGTLYHYRLVATSFDGTSYGQDGTFTTPGVPASVVQPASTPLIASPTVQFPSIAGAITKPQGKAKPKKALAAPRKLASALRACKRQRPRRRRAACEARARRLDRRAAKTNHARKG